MSNAAELRTAITVEIPNGALALVLDLTDVDYLDSAGIHLLYRLRESLRVRGQSFKLVIPGGSVVHDALRLAGVQRYLEVYESPEDAMRALAPDEGGAG